MYSPEKTMVLSKSVATQKTRMEAIHARFLIFYKASFTWNKSS